MAYHCCIQNCNHSYPRSPCRFYRVRNEWKNTLPFTERIKLKDPRACSCHFPKNFNNRLKTPKETIKRQKVRLNMLICGVSNCRADSKKDNRRFYQVPMIDQRDGLKQLSQRRQSAWISALGGRNRDPSLYKNVLVCEAHFISGRSAKLLDRTNPDWVPSQNMGGIEFISVHVGDEDFMVSTASHDSESNFVCGYNVLETNCAKLNKTTFNTNENVRPFKAGEILRNGNGKYSFLCNHCGTVNEDCEEMTKHIDSHFATNNSLIRLDTENTAIPEFISCAVPEDLDMINESETDILNSESFYQNNEVEYDSEGTSKTPCIPKAEPSTVSADLKLKSEWPQSTTKWRFGEKYKNHLKMRSELQSSSKKWRFGEKYKLLYSKNDSPALSSVTSAALGNKSDGSVQGAVIPVQQIKIMYTNNDGMITPTSNLQVVGKMESETRTPDSIVWKVKTEIPSPQKLSLPKPSEITHTNVASTLPLSSLSIPIVAKNKTEIQQTPGWRFGERYQIIYDNPPKSKITYSAAIRKTASSYGFLKLECYQCDSEPPAANESDPKPHECVECLELFSNHVEYRDHILNAHDTTYKCYQCKSEPPITNKLDPRRHKCWLCKEWVFNHVEFEAHLKNVHEMDFHLFNDTKLITCKFSCYVCEKDFLVKPYLREHMKVHYDNAQLVA